jgi:hypothetical protein
MWWLQNHAGHYKHRDLEEAHRCRHKRLKLGRKLAPQVEQPKAGIGGKECDQELQFFSALSTDEERSMFV